MVETKTIPQSDYITEVFSTKNGGIYQCDEDRCWYVDFGGKLARFDYRCLLKLQKAVYNVDIEQHLLKNTREADLEIIFICACDHCYILSILEIITLKEILEGTFTMFQLNNILQDCLYRLPVY